MELEDHDVTETKHTFLCPLYLLNAAFVQLEHNFIARSHMSALLAFCFGR